MSIPPPNPPPSVLPYCPRCGAPNETGLIQCSHCGQSLQAAWPPPPGSAMPPPGYPPQNYPSQNAGVGIGALIPDKNPSALTAYYLGIFSLIPCLAIPMGIAAVMLGVRGLKLFQQHPEVRGRTHAWVGIIAGGFWALVNIVGLIFGVYTSMTHGS